MRAKLSHPHRVFMQQRPGADAAPRSGQSVHRASTTPSPQRRWRDRLRNEDVQRDPRPTLLPPPRPPGITRLLLQRTTKRAERNRRLEPRGVLYLELCAPPYHYAKARRCCTNRDWPARCQPTGCLPADAIRRWSAEGGHPIQNLTAEDHLTPLPSWDPGPEAISDDGLVAEERVLHPALTMVP